MQLPRWDLTTLAGGSHESIVAALDATRKDVDRFAERWRGRVAGLTPEELLGALRESESLLTRLYRPSAYSSLAFSTATDDPAIQSFRSKVQEEVTDISNRLQFFDIEIKQAPQAQVDAWLASEALAHYRHYLRRLRTFAPHTLSEAEEKLASTKAITGSQAWSRLYTELSSSWTFEIEVPGEEKKQHTLAEARALRTHADRAVRKRATEAVLGRFKDNAQVLTFAVNTIYQDHRLEIGMRGYQRPVDPTLLDDELTPEVVEALMSAVEAAYPLAQRYYRIKSRALGIADFGTEDVLAPWEPEEKKIPWDEARSRVLNAFRTVSPKFAEDAAAFFDQRRIDAEPRPGKREGAFCSGMMPGFDPFVLLNYTGRIDDVATLAHELGHGVHFVLAHRAQTLFTFGPTTPLAETASVFGETVLIEQLLAEEKDPKVRKAILASRIEDAISTIMRQVAYTRYEMNAHARCAEGLVPTDGLNALWAAEMKRLYGDSVRMTGLDAHGWLTIPHLVHYRFYCYSYAFGMLLVLALYQRWKKEGDAFIPRYQELLGAGGNGAPTALLGKIGIDIADPAFWKQGLEHVAGLVDQFEPVAGA